MNNKNARATSNLAMLEIVARKLGKLNDKVVYLGGCATALLINDPLSLDIRATRDVDCIIDIISLGDYYKFEKELRGIGFTEDNKDNIICRWLYDEIILDIMPTDEKILGFGNPWYKEALEYAVPHQISNNLIIKSITAPYFIATKIEAFRTRGNNDILGSYDFEDIITIVAGRLDIGNEIASASNKLKLFLKQFFEELLKNPKFEPNLSGHLNDGPASVTMQRVRKVMSLIKKIAG
ncbi:MAG TPA: hypothetical protein VNK03_07550 [Gammaproteobacteria bacterium]|nr:hypothetical protein [Gammaproteobacteria bacterium]